MSMDCAECIVTNIHKIIEFLWSKISRYASGIKFWLNNLLAKAFDEFST